MANETDNTNPFDKHVRLGANTEGLSQFVQELNAKQKDGTAILSDNRPLKSAASLLLDTASAVPGETGKQLLRDLSEDKTHIAAEAAKGAAVGVAFTAAFKFAPRLGYAGAALLAAKGLYDLGTGSGEFIANANGATDRAAQERLALSASKQVGRTLADSVEGLPGMVAGGWGATKIVGVPRLYADANSALVDPIKNRLAFMGPGVRNLPSALDKGASVDVLALSRMLKSEHPWQGIETGRTVDLSSMRLSRQVSGTETGLSHLPATQKTDTINYHTHSPARRAHPGIDDNIATTNLGIVTSGPETVVYIGQRAELTNLMRNGQGDSFVGKLNAVSFNETNGTAMRLVGTWDKTLRGWRLDEQATLDYTKTIEALRNLDKTAPNAWRTLSRLPAHIQ